MWGDREEEIYDLFQKAVEERRSWDGVYAETSKYLGRVDYNNFYTNYDVSYTKKTDGLEIYDNTAENAEKQFVSNLQSTLTPAGQKWMKLTAGTLTPPEYKELVTRELEYRTDVIFDAIHNSDFDTQAAECYHDLALGTACMLVLEGESPSRPIEFHAVPISELYIMQGKRRNIDTVFRLTSMRATEIQKVWKDATLTDEMRQKIQYNDTKKIQLIEGTIPEKIEVMKLIETVKDGIPTQKRERVEVDGYRYIVMDKCTRQIIYENEQETSPWICWRWDVMPNETYGKGVAVNVLNDIKTLNVATKYILARAGLEAFPPYTVENDNGIFDIENIQICPNALIPVPRNGGGGVGASISILPMSPTFSTIQFSLEEKTKSIKEAMFASPLGEVNAPVKTATEIAYRQQELSRRIGSSFGRLQNEFLRPLINRVMYLLDKQGLFNNSPNGSIDLGQGSINIKYESPLQTAQNQDGINNISQFVQLIAGMFGVESVPAIMQRKELINYIAESLSIPRDVYASDEDLINKLQEGLNGQA